MGKGREKRRRKSAVKASQSSKAKAPVQEFDPPTEKRPVEAPDAGWPNYKGGHLSWRFSDVDRDGPFSWVALGGADYQRVMEKLHCFETMHEHQIKEAGCHEVEVDGLSKEAKKRLQDIEKDDEDVLMSFRISGKERVLCRVRSTIMVTLWWDPDHQVYPSKKKYT